MSIPRVPPVTRRVSLVAAGGTVLVTLAGCTDSPEADPTSNAPSSPGPTPSSSPSTDSDTATDERLVGEARSQLLRAIDLIRRTTTSHAGLSPVLAPLLDLHLAHDAVLTDSSPDAVAAPGPVVPDTRERALRVVRRVESRLPGELATLAQQAASGDLARILASMSAATAQQVSVGAT